MTLTLDLPGDLERKLAAEAARLGVSIAEYAVRVLAGSRSTSTTSEITTGADLVAYWEREGVIGTRPEITDPSEHARRIRAKAERRHAE